MLHEFVTAHSLLVKIVCFMLPMLVMMFGPSDAAVRRLWHGLPLRVWQWETLAVMAAVYIVIAVAGNSPGEWIGFAALVFAHGRNSVMFRLAEQQRASMPADPHHVECWRWNLVYFCLGEGFWALYFTYHESWAGLAGVGIFSAYAQWRRYYTGRQARLAATLAMKAAEASQEKCPCCDVPMVDFDSLASINGAPMSVERNKGLSEMPSGR